jgi:hypothetical protein
MIEDEFAELLAMVTEQLRGQNDRVADRFAERSAAVRDPLRRRDIAREVRPVRRDRWYRRHGHSP